MLLTFSCLTRLPITGNATVRRHALPVCAAPILKTEARRMHWAYTANVCTICDCQQALATLADTRVWVGRSPLAARVYLGQPTMEKVSIFVSPLPPPVAGWPPMPGAEHRSVCVCVCMCVIVHGRRLIAMRRAARIYRSGYVLTLLDRARCGEASYRQFVEFSPRRETPIHPLPHAMECRVSRVYGPAYNANLSGLGFSAGHVDIDYVLSPGW